MTLLDGRRTAEVWREELRAESDRLALRLGRRPGLAVVRVGWTDTVGIGRMVLSYWDMPRHTLAGEAFQEKRICRTFSDCTTGPRNGMISGCFPLDPYYKDAPEAEQLKQKKAEMRKALSVR